MQIHGPSDHLHDGNRIYAELNPGHSSGSPFVDMRIGPVRLYIDTPEECDWLIAAAAEAKRLLSPPQGSHPYPDGQDATAIVAQSIATGIPVIVDDEPYPPLSEAAELDELEPLPKSLACPRTNPHTAHGTCPGSAPEFDEPIEIVNDNYPAQVQP